MNVNYIKKDYALPEAQDDLRNDAIILFGMNISNNYRRFNKTSIKKEEIDVLVDLFRKIMYNENENKEWDQTS